MFTKHILIILITLCISSQLLAQIEKGTKRIGPDVSISSQFSAGDPNNSASTINYVLGLTGGYFILNNLELGAVVDLSGSNARFGNQTSSSSFGITAGPELVYMTHLQENLYLPLSAGYGFSRFTGSSNSGNTSFNGNEFSLGAGLEYIILNKLGVRFTVEYKSVNFRDNNSNNIPSISANRIFADVGFNFYF